MTLALLQQPLLAPALQRTTSIPWYRRATAFAQSIVGLWPLDEASGNGLPLIGASPLVDNNGVGSAAGLTAPLAREFIIAGSDFFSIVDNATISTGNINFWGCIWCMPYAVNVTSVIAGKWNTTGNREWQIAQVNADISFTVSPNGTATGVGSVTLPGVLTANRWTMICWYHDATNDLLGLSIDGAGFATAAYSGGVFDSAAALNVARQSGGGALFGGRLQQLVLGKNYVPSLADIWKPYNERIDNGVASLYFIGYGGEVDWSADGSTLVFDRRDGSGVYQLHTMAADGSGDTAISGTVVSGAPSVDRHKGFPAWHPSGDYIVCQAEQEDSPDTTGLAEPGRGWWNNVWVLTPDGQTWWQLTDYPVASNNGVLNPRFNAAGTKLLWAKKIGPVVEGSAPFGSWNLQLADFAVVEGVPTLSNIVTLTPGSKTFYESHGFSRDGTKILYTADPDTGNLYGFDIFSCNLDGSGVTNLTASDAQWDEHAHHAPHADVMSFLSSRTYPGYTATTVTGLRGEAHGMSADATNKRRLTNFNLPGFAEYDSEASVAGSSAWHPNGGRLAIVRLMLGARYDTAEGRQLWIARFNSAYE